MNETKTKTGLPERGLAVFIEALKKDQYEVEYKDILYRRKKDGGWYIDGTKVFLSEDIRIDWSKLNGIQRLKARTGPIDVQPGSDYIIFRPLEIEVFKKSKLVLTDMPKDKDLSSVFSEMPFQGIVVAVGPGFFTDSGKRRPVGCAVGDHVILKFELHLVSEFLYKGQLYYMCRESQLIGPSGEEYREYLSKHYELDFKKS